MTLVYDDEQAMTGALLFLRDTEVREGGDAEEGGEVRGGEGRDPAIYRTFLLFYSLSFSFLLLLSFWG